MQTISGRSSFSGNVRFPTVISCNVTRWMIAIWMLWFECSSSFELNELDFVSSNAHSSWRMDVSVNRTRVYLCDSRTVCRLCKSIYVFLKCLGVKCDNNNSFNNTIQIQNCLRDRWECCCESQRRKRERLFVSVVVAFWINAIFQPKLMHKWGEPILSTRYASLPFIWLFAYYTSACSADEMKQEKTLKNLNYFNCTIYRVISFVSLTESNYMYALQSLFTINNVRICNEDKRASARARTSASHKNQTQTVRSFGKKPPNLSVSHIKAHTVQPTILCEQNADTLGTFRATAVGIT